MSSAHLADLAQKITTEVQAADAASERWVQHARAAGQFLITAKTQLTHGKWLPWLRDQCGVSARTAQGYMRLARLTDQQAQHVADMSLRKALQATATPKAKLAAVLAPSYFVLVTCQAEPDQAALLDRLKREGFKCHALMS